MLQAGPKRSKTTNSGCWFRWLMELANLSSTVTGLATLDVVLTLLAHAACFVQCTSGPNT
jgi:hypothetical protein